MPHQSPILDNARAWSAGALCGDIRGAMLDSRARLLHRWLDSWRGIDHVVAGTARQGRDAQLAEYDAERWRRTFFIASEVR